MNEIQITMNEWLIMTDTWNSTSIGPSTLARCKCKLQLSADSYLFIHFVQPLLSIKQRYSISCSVFKVKLTTNLHCSLSPQFSNLQSIQFYTLVSSFNPSFNFHHQSSSSHLHTSYLRCWCTSLFCNLPFILITYQISSD